MAAAAYFGSQALLSAIKSSIDLFGQQEEADDMEETYDMEEAEDMEEITGMEKEEKEMWEETFK